ncbi:MAG: hypothetical protein HRU43_06600 [Simkaniaceae bacterium]|nr:hypothetical protein [Simkaniaceae bacterium]
MDNLQISKAHLPKKYEDYVTAGLVKGEYHYYKKQNYFVQINLFKMESDGANKDAVAIVAKSAKRVFGAVYHQGKKVFKAEPGGCETMPAMLNVLGGGLAVHEKEVYSGDPLNRDQQALLKYLAQTIPTKPPQDTVNSKQAQKKDTKAETVRNVNSPQLTPTPKGKKYKATLFLMTVVALGFFAHKVHKGDIKLPSNLPSKQDLLDSWTQFKEGFNTRLANVPTKA